MIKFLAMALLTGVICFVWYGLAIILWPIALMADTIKMLMEKIKGDIK